MQLKYKGNQNQFELNAGFDSISENTEVESEHGEPNLERLKKLFREARQLNCK